MTLKLHIFKYVMFAYVKQVARVFFFFHIITNNDF